MLTPGSLGKHDPWQVIPRLMKAEDENTSAVCLPHAALSLSVSVGYHRTHHIVSVSPAEPIYLKLSYFYSSHSCCSIAHAVS